MLKSPSGQALVLTLGCATAACCGAFPSSLSEAPTVPLHDDLGVHHHPISTQVDAAQLYFDQGVRLTYGFNYSEAILSFEEAVRLDPDCAMCWWGIAWPAGPNINAIGDADGGASAYAAIGEAQARTGGADMKERVYIDALALRYGEDPMADWIERDSAYAAAMVDLARRYPDDQVLAAEALMMLSPWDYWDEDGSPHADTELLLDLLRPVTESNPDHAGACSTISSHRSASWSALVSGPRSLSSRHPHRPAIPDGHVALRTGHGIRSHRPARCCGDRTRRASRRASGSGAPAGQRLGSQYR